MSQLIMNVGGMFSGKTTELQRQGKRNMMGGKKVCFIKPAIDNRYSEDEIVTHDGTRVSAINIGIKESILDYIDADCQVVLIDEIQFFDTGIIDDIEELLDAGVFTVYASGLDMDWKGIPFETTMWMMAIADEVNKFHAVCQKCGEDAMFSAKKVSNDRVVELGEKDLYMALCRSCYTTHMRKESQHG